MGSLVKGHRWNVAGFATREAAMIAERQDRSQRWNRLADPLAAAAVGTKEPQAERSSNLTVRDHALAPLHAPRDCFDLTALMDTERSGPLPSRGLRSTLK